MDIVTRLAQVHKMDVSTIANQYTSRPELSDILDQGAFFAQGYTKGQYAAMAFLEHPSLLPPARQAFMDGVLTGMSLALASPPSGPTEGHRRMIYEGARTALSITLYPSEPDNVFPGGKILGVNTLGNAYVIQATTIGKQNTTEQVEKRIDMRRITGNIQ